MTMTPEEALAMARECAAEAKEGSFTAHLAPECIEEIREGGHDDWEEVQSALLAIDRMQERVRAETERCAKLNRCATDRQYMIEALVSMLGPNGLSVWNGWQEKGVLRVHYSWGPDVVNVTGEERAAAILRWDEAVKNSTPVENLDEDFEQIDVRQREAAIRETPHAE